MASASASASGSGCEQVCAKHGLPVTFCPKCVRLLCPTCLEEDPACQVGPSEAHKFTNLRVLPGWLRNQLDSIQEQLRAEQSALLDAAKRSSAEMTRKDEQLHAAVDRTVQSMHEALQILMQLQTAINAAAASEIAGVLRAGVESSASKQRVEDVHARAIACRQMSTTVDALRNLDDSNLARPINIAFVRNLVRCSCTETEPASPPTPAPSDLQSIPAPSTHLPQANQESPIESQLKYIVQQAKLLIHALESTYIFKVFAYPPCHFYVLLTFMIYK